MPALDSAFVKEAARAAGFSEAGVARAHPLDPGPLERILSRGWEADMAWLRTTREERLDPSRLLPGVRSVVALALGYFSGREEPDPEGGIRMARYARGRDYHRVMKRKLAGLVARGHGFGLLGNIIIGIIGAFVGGLVFPMFGIAASGFVGETLFAAAGAILLLVVIGLVRRI